MTNIIDGAYASITRQLMNNIIGEKHLMMSICHIQDFWFSASVHMSHETFYSTAHGNSTAFHVRANLLCNLYNN